MANVVIMNGHNASLRNFGAFTNQRALRREVESPINWSVSHYDIRKKDKDGNSLLMLMAASGKIHALEHLMTTTLEGLDVNECNNSRDTALIQASAHNRIEVMKFLLQQPNIQVNHKNQSQRSAFLKAAEHGHLEAMELLLSHGANINEIDKQGNSALYLATLGNQVDAVKFLLSRGASLQYEKWNTNESAMELAQRRGYDQIIHLFDRAEN